MKSKHLKTYSEILSSFVKVNGDAGRSQYAEAAEIYAAQWSDTLTRYRSHKEDAAEQKMLLTPHDKSLLQELRNKRPIFKEDDRITYNDGKDNPVWHIIGVMLSKKVYRVRRKLPSGGYRTKDLIFRVQSQYRTI